MTTHRIENAHIEELNKLLLNSGVTCVRSTLESEESSLSTEETEKNVEIKEEEEELVEVAIEEETTRIAEEVEEEMPEIFPTPSLRKILPEKIRHIEKQNQIHVLPEEFKTDIDAQRIPKIASTPAQKYIDELAELTGCSCYKNSLSEFWFLDTLANLLRRAQEDQMDKPTQAILILWFCEWMKEMQHFDAADRQRMLRRFKDNMLAAARYVAKENKLPTPVDIGVTYKNEDVDDVSRPPPLPVDSKHLVTFEGTGFECSLHDLTKIIHYIYDLFSTDYQYDLIRSVFTFTPEYQLIDTPHQIRNPKRLYTPLKVKPKDVSKKEQKTSRGKNKEGETKEYLHLLQLQSDIEREKEEQEEKEREEWHRRNHVLPLAFAVNQEFFDKYWPPTTSETVPESEPEARGKGKNKKK